VPWVIVGTLVALVALGAPVLGRRRRRLAALVRAARRRALPHDRAVVALWKDAAAAIGRHAHETPHEHAVRVANGLDRGGAGAWDGRRDADARAAYGELARLAAWAAYSGHEVTLDQRTTARRLHAGAVRTLARR
jgi:hypothetical protein